MKFRWSNYILLAMGCFGVQFLVWSQADAIDKSPGLWRFVSFPIFYIAGDISNQRFWECFLLNCLVWAGIVSAALHLVALLRQTSGQRR